MITCTTPHALKYLLPEYSSPRDSTVSSQRRYRYHLENVSAIRKALEKHAEDIAVEGFAVGERLRFKRSIVNKIKENIADTIWGMGKFFKLVNNNNMDQQKQQEQGGLFASKKRGYYHSEDNASEEMSRLVDNNNNNTKDDDDKKNA